MWVSKITKEDLTNDMTDCLLFEGLNDNGVSADCIIVLGSITAAKYRVPVAAEAFFSGRVEKIMLCGGKIRDFSCGSMTEAEHMYKKALVFPSHISVYPCPADDITTRRDNWMKTPEGIDRVKAEALNIAGYVNNGVIPDFEIFQRKFNGNKTVNG